MAAHLNKTCNGCGNNWYPGPKDPATTCPACGGTDLVSYIETGKGGGSSFVAQKSAYATPMLILGVLASLALGFFWYTENLAPEENPFREQFDRHLYGKRAEDLDDGDAPTKPTKTSGGAAAGSSTTTSGGTSAGETPTKRGDGSAAGSGSARPLPPVGPDRLHMADGRVLLGKVMAEADDTVGFKYRNARGKVVMKVFKRALIARVEKKKK